MLWGFLQASSGICAGAGMALRWGQKFVEECADGEKVAETSNKAGGRFCRFLEAPRFDDGSWRPSPVSMKVYGPS